MKGGGGEELIDPLLGQIGLNACILGLNIVSNLTKEGLMPPYPTPWLCPFGKP